MLKCSESAIAGGTFIHPHPHPSAVYSSAHTFGLTKRQDEVLRTMAAGRIGKIAAEFLGIALKTYYIHRNCMLKKMGARNAAHAVALGFVSGLLTEKDLEEGI